MAPASTSIVVPLEPKVESWQNLGVSFCSLARFCVFTKLYRFLFSGSLSVALQLRPEGFAAQLASGKLKFPEMVPIKRK